MIFFETEFILVLENF